MNEQQQPIMDWKTQLKLVAGSAAAAEVINLLAHGGWEGALFGAAAAAILGSQSPKFLEGLRDILPVDLIEQLNEREPGKRSIMDKLWGRYPDEPASVQEVTTEQLEPQETRVLPETREQRNTQAVVHQVEEDEYDWNFEDDEEMSLPSTQPTGMFTLSQLLASGFVPTLNKIFVGRLMDGTDVFIEAKHLCHGALAGTTGNGKSSIMRMLMAQLCKSGASVVMLNPHYTPYNRESDEDWTPFIPYLERDPLACSKVEYIKQCLEHMAGKMLEIRQARVQSGQLPGKPYFVFIDELPSIVKKCPEVASYMEFLLREGRKYWIFLIVASQDFLVKTIGTEGGAVRQCFRTAFYVGGDTTTARNILDRDVQITETDLGKGVIMLRCSATKKSVMARVPYTDNESIYKLLGPSTFVQRPEVVTEDIPVQPQAKRQPTASVNTNPIVTPANVDRVQQVRRERVEARRQAIRSKSVAQVEKHTEPIATVSEPTIPEMTPVERKAQQEQELLEKGIKAYQDGYTTVGKFAATMSAHGLTQWQARQLLDKVKVELEVV